MHTGTSAYKTQAPPLYQGVSLGLERGVRSVGTSPRGTQDTGAFISLQTGSSLHECVQSLTSQAFLGAQAEAHRRPLDPSQPLGREDAVQAIPRVSSESWGAPGNRTFWHVLACPELFLPWGLWHVAWRKTADSVPQTPSRLDFLDSDFVCDSTWACGRSRGALTSVGYFHELGSSN